MKITIEVTAEDINNGVRKNCMKCPVALALKRTFLTDVFANYSTLNIGLVNFDTAPSVREFISRFDIGITVLPISFQLTIPEEIEVYLNP